MPLSIGAVLMTALAGTAWVSITAKVLSPVSFLPIALILAMSVALGLAWRSLCLPRHEPIGLIDALLSGVFLASLLLFVFAFTMPFGMQMNVLLLLLLTTGATTLLARSKKLAPLQMDGAELGAMAISLVAATAWSQETLAGLRPGPEGLVSSPWGDVFVHATRLFSFVLSPSASALQDPTMAGQPPEFYHYGSYFLPAALMRLGDVDAYTMAAGFYPAFGLFLTGLAAFAVIRTFSSNRAVALIGSALFMLMPDPSFQGLDNRFTSYFFFQQVGANGAYAVALLGLAWSDGMRAIRLRSWPYLWVAVGWVAASLFFKSQIFLVYSLSLLLFFCFFFENRLRWLAGTGVLACYSLGCAVLQKIPHTPTLKLSTWGAQKNLDQIIASFPADFKPPLLALLPAGASYPRYLLVGIPLILLCTYGVALIPFSVFSLRAICRRQSQLPVQFILPLLALLSHLVIALALSPNLNYGDLFEIIHKTFVWPYFVISVLAYGMVATLLVEKNHLSHGWGKVLVLALGVLLLTASTLNGKKVLSGLHWEEKLNNLPIPSALYEVTQYVRKNVPEQEIVQMSVNDNLLITNALMERTSYVTHLSVNHGPPAAEPESRFRRLNLMLSQPQLPELRAQARALGIQWLIIPPFEQYAWERQGDITPVFASGNFRLYDVR